jgi:hypothetical protein
MTNLIPIFPLPLVAFPDEKLNLHIFEPRYKQLINDCFQNNKPFGIPPVINNNISEVGTMMQIVEISKVYPDGKMDIKTKGLEIFKTLDIIKELPDKLYAGAIVTYPSNQRSGIPSLMNAIVKSMRKVHQIISTNKKFDKPDDLLCSYDIAHHVGLSLEEEYCLLEYTHEVHRQEFLRRHINETLKVLDKMELLKKKVQLNGYFRNIEGYRF